MKILSLVVLALAGCSLLVAKSSSHSVLGHQNDLRIVRTADLFHDLEDYKRDAKSDKKFVLDGKVYEAAYDTTRAHIPLAFMSELGKEEHFKINGQRDYYNDAKNHAMFTVSRHWTEEGREKKSLRGNILLPETNEHLVLEPHEDSKLNADGFHVYSKVYKTSNAKPYHVVNATIHKDFVTAPMNIDVSRPASTPGAVNNYVELFMVADNFHYQAVIKRLGKSDDASVALYIEAYFAQLEYLASQCYARSLANTPNLKITVVATQIYILKNSQPFSGPSYYTSLNGASTDRKGKQYLNANTALDALNSWAATTFKGKNYDAVVGITASNICFIDDGASYPENDGLVGLAPLNGVCQPGYNAFIIEEWLDYSMAYTLAHELAHNLGADHDDVYQDDRCTDEDYYIMAPVNQDQNFLNSFYFSPCSIEVFVKKIYTQNREKCLANPVQPDSDINRFSSYFPGQVYNLTQQCQLEFGPSYFADLQEGYDDPDSDLYVCQQILCAQEGTLTVTSRSYSFKQGPGAVGSAAFERTSCGNGKWCVAGECKADPAAPKGDIPVEYHGFCDKIAKYFGNDYACQVYYGACYGLCNPGSTVIKPLSSQSMSNWLSTNNVDNTHFL